MSSIKNSILFVCLILMDRTAMIVTSPSAVHKTHCQYNKSASNVKFSKLVMDGQSVEIEGTSYHCSNGSMTEKPRLVDTTDIKFGETSVAEHHVSKRSPSVIGGILLGGLLIGGIICIFVCSDPPPPPPPPPQLTCPDSGKVIYAQRGETKAVHSWSEPTATGGDNRNPIILATERKSGSYFERGIHTVTYTVSDRRGYEDICSFTFMVKVISCLPIQPSSNSKVTCDGEFIYGSSCSVKCNEGYEMVPTTNNNEQVISCEKSGKTGVHSESPNTCKAIKCPNNDPAISPANGVAVCSSSNYEYQTVCTVHCNSGYTPIEGQNAKCQSNKKWSNTLAGCEDSEKPTINGCPADIYTNAERNNQPVNISWTAPTASDNSGTATVTQMEGLPPGSSFSLGHHKIVYTASDANGNASPNCTFYVHVTGLTCIPPQISDRYLTYDCADGYGYGSSCKLNCMGSFPLIGNDTITCEKISNASMESTYWDVGSTTPYCKTNPCNPLPPPVNGAISCALWLFGQICQMQCQEKYDIPFGTKSDNGVSDFNGQFVCSQTTGRYMPSNTVPNCTEVRDVRFSSLPGEYFYYVGDCNDDETLKQIKENFISLMMQLEDNDFDGVCPNTTECNVNNTEVTCGPTSGRRKRSADDTDSDLYLLLKHDYKRSASEIRVSFSVMTSWGNSNPSMDTFLHWEKVQQNVFDSIKESAKSGNFNVNGLSPDIDSFSYGWSDPHCPEGTTIKWSTMTCVPCPVGTYLDKSNPSVPKCRNCPKGTFKDNEDDVLCTPCPRGMSTSTDGAEALSECKEICKKGEFSDNGLKPCNVCPRSRYQSKEMSTSCEECPHGKTSNPGSSSVGNCSEFDIFFSNPGDAIVFENSQNDETKSLTISTWINNYNSSLTLLQGYSSSSINITYGERIDIEIFGSKTTLNIAEVVHNWHHLVIVLNGDTATTSVYINGKLKAQQHIPTVANVSLIAPSSKFAVTLNEDSPRDILITGYQITSHILSKDEIEALSSSCQYTRNDTIVTASKLDWTNLQNPQMIVPSQCDNIDQCSPNPCNGHKCTDRVRSYSCHCDNGFFGENCEISPNYCRDTPCKNGGTCQNRNDTYTCMCSQMYKGRNCEIPKVNGGWSVWSTFSECSASCNGGVKTRSRVCNNPAPDPDGLPCDLSKSTEMLPCNSETCPSCPTLRRSFGNILNCSDVNEDEVCTVSCQPGYTFVPGNLPLKEYRCGQSTGYTWNGQTPACGRAGMPRRLSTVSTTEYKPAIPCDKTSTALNSVQSKLEATLSCYQHAICAITTTTRECSSSRRRKRSTSSVEITLTATLSEQNLDLKSYYTNGNLSDSLRTLVNTVVEIENSTRILNDTDGILNFDIDGTRFSPAGMQVTGIVDCDNGQGSDGPVCIDCPVGTYSTSGNCNLCAKGTYQDEIGQVVCKSCPTGLTTKYIGSQDASSCTELVDSIQNNTQQTPASRETEINVIVIVGVSVSLGVLLILLTGIFFWYYHTKCSTRQRRSKSRLSLGSFLSLRKVAPEVDDIKVNDYIIMPPVQHKPVFDVKAL